MAQKPSPAAARQAKPVETPDVALARTIGRALWDREFKASNPDATPQAKQAAWNDAKRDYIKTGRQIANRLNRAGFTFDIKKA
ncbi:hypothetical protein [Falsiroseomonas sp.]|uniref:hypothetical protein n=1 Tax=Falsiroseomonas sp. TaxID=2870721 RepID=UPI00356608B8